MSITLTCPRCSHKQKIEDDKAGKEVPCKICHHAIKADSVGARPSSPKAKKTKLAPDELGIQAAPPRKPAAQRDEDDAPKSRGGARDRSARSRKDDPGSNGMMYGLIAGGALLLLFVLCAGGSLGAFYFMSSRDKPDDPPAEVNVVVLNDPAPNQPVQIQPAPFPNQPFPNQPFPQPPPFPNQPPPLDPNNPNEIDKVLPLLKGPQQNREPAYIWLERADPNHPRRGEVARLLESSAEDPRQQPFSHYFPALFRWATKDNTPTLIRVMEQAQFPDRRQKAIQTLARLKDASAVEAIARRFTDFFDRAAAGDALREFGPVAQTAVMKYYNHRDGGTRQTARQLIDGFKTPAGVIADQCLKDLEAPDAGQRDASLEWFAKNPLDVQKQAQVARSLNKCIVNERSFGNGNLVKALETWGTAENVPALVGILNQANLGRADVVRILGKIRDPNGLKAVARRMDNFFDRGEVFKTLKECGTLAERAVIEAMTATKDGNSRAESAKLLGEIGTRANSIPVLQTLMFQHQKNIFERNFIQNAQVAIVAINQRGK